MMKAKVVGMPSLMKKFSKLEQVAQKRILEAALVSGALIIQNAAKKNCPWVSRNLARSIHVGGHSEKSELADSTGSDLGTPNTGLGHASVLIGTNVVYAKRVEFGFSKQDSLGRHYSQAGQPYLTRAAAEKQDEALAEVSDTLKVLVKKAV